MKYFDKHSKNGEQWMFRGQRIFGRTLRTSLERATYDAAGLKEKDDEEARRKLLKEGLKGCSTSQLEKRLIREFMRKSYHYLKPVPDECNLLEWVSLMQHYGAPTRLLDWTYSFFVAVYFAVEKAEEDCAVFAIESRWSEEILKQKSEIYKEYNEKCKSGVMKPEYLTPKYEEDYFKQVLFKEEIRQETPQPCLHLINPYRLNERLVIHQGVFLFPEDLSKPFEDNLAATFDPEGKGNWGSERNYIKYRIKYSAREELLQNLHRMNINRASLFPGLDGFAKSLSAPNILELLATQ